MQLSRDSRAAQRIEIPDHVGDSCFGCPSVGQPAESCLGSDSAAKDWLNSTARDRLHVTYRRFVMVSASNPKPSRTKVRAHRERLRAQGLRPIQIWVPDVRSPSFRSEAHRQSAAIAASAHAREDQAFIDAVSDWGDE